MTMNKETKWGYNQNHNEAFSYTRYQDGTVVLPERESLEEKKHLHVGYDSRQQAEEYGPHGKPSPDMVESVKSNPIDFSRFDIQAKPSQGPRMR